MCPLQCASPPEDYFEPLQEKNCRSSHSHSHSHSHSYSHPHPHRHYDCVHPLRPNVCCTSNWCNSHGSAGNRTRKELHKKHTKTNPSTLCQTQTMMHIHQRREVNHERQRYNTQKSHKSRSRLSCGGERFSTRLTIPMKFPIRAICIPRPNTNGKRSTHMHTDILLLCPHVNTSTIYLSNNYTLELTLTPVAASLNGASSLSPPPPPPPPPAPFSNRFIFMSQSGSSPPPTALPPFPPAALPNMPGPPPAPEGLGGPACPGRKCQMHAASGQMQHNRARPKRSQAHHGHHWSGPAKGTKSLVSRVLVVAISCFVCWFV